MSDFNDFLSHFNVGKRRDNKVQAFCPAHKDDTASLSITLVDSKILVFCHAGCTVDAILSAVSLKFSDLFLDGGRSPEAIYQYRAKDSKLLYEKLKYRKPSGEKEFYPRRLTSDGKIAGNLEGVSRVPYNYPQIVAAIKNGELIVYDEGEKDAETARLLGYCGTTMGGASDWKDEYKGFFRNAKLIQIPDKDDPGIKLAQNITKSLCGVCKSVKVVILPHGKDLTEWVELGHGRAELSKLISEAPELVKSDKFDWHSAAIEHDQLLSKNLQPLELLVAELITIPSLVVLAAPKKRCKSWMGLQLSQSVASGAPFLGKTTRQGAVIHMALEDGERRLRQRLEMQNTKRGLPITYLTKFEPLNSKAGWEQLVDLIKERHPALLVIDTLAAAKNRFVDENDAGSIGDLFNRLHALALSENLVIFIIAHHGKLSTGDAGFDIRGSSAIPGATDVNLGLYKNADGSFDLKAEGRDISDVDLRISFDAEQTWSWQYKGDAKDVRRSEAEEQILEALDLLGGGAETSAIAKEVELSRPTVNSHLKRMRGEGKVGFKSLNTGKGRKIIYTSISSNPTNPNNDNANKTLQS